VTSHISTKKAKKYSKLYAIKAMTRSERPFAAEGHKYGSSVNDGTSQNVVGSDKY